MEKVVIVLPVTLTVHAIYSEYVLQQVRHDPIRLAHLNFFVALRAWQIELLDVAFTDVFLDSGKLAKAFVACACPAFGALEYIRNHQHANWTFEVLRLHSESCIVVKVFFLNSIRVLVSASFDHLTTVDFSVYLVIQLFINNKNTHKFLRQKETPRSGLK